MKRIHSQIMPFRVLSTNPWINVHDEWERECNASALELVLHTLGRIRMYAELDIALSRATRQPSAVNFSCNDVYILRIHSPQTLLAGKVYSRFKYICQVHLDTFADKPGANADGWPFIFGGTRRIMQRWSGGVKDETAEVWLALFLIDRGVGRCGD